MECEECRSGLEDIEPDTCGHSGTLFWCPIHKRYECEKCHLEDKKKESSNGEE